MSKTATTRPDFPPRDPRLHDPGRMPQGNGTGGPGYSIKGEFARNGFKNDLKHTPGVLSMARAIASGFRQAPSSYHARDLSHLDGEYAAFGHVIEGMDVVNKIAECRTDWSDRPMKEQKMKKVTVDTFGEEYPEPEKC